MWLCSYVAVWLCGYVAMWPTNSKTAKIAKWFLGFLASWFLGFFVSSFQSFRVSKFQSSKFQSSRFQNLKKNKLTTVHNIIFSKFKNWNHNFNVSISEISQSLVHAFPKMFKIWDSQICKNNIFYKWFGICFYSLKYFCNKYGAQGSIFGQHFESSKNVHQSIGIHPQALISNVKLIINHNPPQTYHNECQINPTITWFFL